MHHPYTSDTFYHMVGWSILGDAEIAPDDKNEECYKLLKEVLDFGFIAGADGRGKREKQECLISITTDMKGHLRNGDFKGFLAKGVITCYADIPRPSLGLHARKYGLFGFGVSSKYLAFLGARPVSYIPVENDGSMQPSYRGHGLLNNMTNEILKLHKVVDEWEDDHNPLEEGGGRTINIRHPQSVLATILTRDVAAFIKPYDQNLPLDHPDCYYTEREWRLLGNVEIKQPNVTTITVAKGYADRLLQDVPRARNFIIEEL